MLRSFPASLGICPGCLIEAQVLQLGGLPALLEIVKLAYADRPGQAFGVSVTVPRAASRVVVIPARCFGGRSTSTRLVRVPPEEAMAAVTNDTCTEAFKWVGRMVGRGIERR